MDDTVGSEDVNGNDPAVKVDGQTLESDVGAHALCLATNSFAFEEGGDGVRYKDTTSRVKVGGDVVGQDLLQVFLGWLGCMLGNLLERIVGGCEDSEVGSSAVEKLDDVLVLIDQGCELSSVLALGNEFVDGQVGLVRMAMVAVVTQVLNLYGGGVDPGFGIEGGLEALLANFLAGLLGVVNGLVEGSLGSVGEVGEGVLELADKLVLAR